MDVESFLQLGLPTGQIMPTTRVGDYENNWQTQNLNHRRRNRRRRSRKDWNSSHS